MKNLKNIPNLIMWHDGMTLCPQHFQQGFSRSEGLLQYYHINFSPYAYGIVSMDFDESLLPSGLFKLSAIEMVFADGYAYYYDSTTDGVLEIDLNAYKNEFEKTKEIKLNIVIPNQLSRTNILNTSASRFKSITSESTFDEVTGQNDILIPRLRPNVRLELERFTKTDLTVIPLAVISFENEMFVLRPYTPPSLFIKQGTKVWDLCLSVAKHIRYKIQTVIEDVQRMKHVSQATYTFDRYFFLRNLKDSLLRFEVCLRSEKTHPFLLFVEFVELYSKIISTDLDVVLPAPPEYNHLAILESFEKVKNAVIEFIEREVPTNYNTVHLSKIGSRYESKITDDFLFDTNHVLLGIKRPVEVDKTEFTNWIHSLLICDDRQFSAQFDRRTRGYQREIIDRYQDLLPQRNIILVLVTLDRLFPKNGTLAIAALLEDKFNFVPDDFIIYGKRT